MEQSPQNLGFRGEKRTVRKWISMRSWSTRSALLLTGWICILVGSASASPPVPEHNRSNGADIHYENKQRNTHGSDRIAFPMQGLYQPSQQKPNNHQSDSDQPWWQTAQWVAVFIAAIYSLFAGLQWWSIQRQSNNLISLERPWVFPGYVKLAKFPPLAGIPNAVEFNWTNNGRTLAVIVEQNIEVRLVDSLPWRPRYKQRPTSGYGILSPNLLSPKQQTPFTISLSDISQINVGKKSLYWLGYIIYEDAFRKCHTYRFCFKYFPGSGIFAAEGPKRYNWRN